MIYNRYHDYSHVQLARRQFYNHVQISICRGMKIKPHEISKKKKKKSTRWYIYRFRNAKIYIRQKNYSQVNFIIQHFYSAFCLFFIKISERFIVKKKKCFFIHSTFIARVTINQHPINIRSNVLQLKKQNKKSSIHYPSSNRINISISFKKKFSRDLKKTRRNECGEFFFFFFNANKEISPWWNGKQLKRGDTGMKGPTYAIVTRERNVKSWSLCQRSHCSRIPSIAKAMMMTTLSLWALGYGLEEGKWKKMSLAGCVHPLRAS